MLLYKRFGVGVDYSIDSSFNCVIDCGCVVLCGLFALEFDNYCFINLFSCALGGNRDLFLKICFKIKAQVPSVVVCAVRCSSVFLRFILILVD